MKGLLLFLLFLSGFMVAAQTSSTEQQWLEFISREYKPGIVPWDNVLGPLANRKDLSLTFRNVLDFCDRFFEEMAVKGIPEELFWPPLRVPLKKEFSNVLEGLVLKLEERRYGKPVQDDRRMSVPVRVKSGDEIRHGHLYLILDNGEWYLEQIKLNLAGMPMEPLPEPEPPPSESEEASESREGEEEENSQEEQTALPGSEGSDEQTQALEAAPEPKSEQVTS